MAIAPSVLHVDRGALKWRVSDLDRAGNRFLDSRDDQLKPEIMTRLSDMRQIKNLPVATGSLPLRAQSDNNNSDDDDGGSERGTSVITRTKPKTKKPSLYRVLLLNDDFTPMEFVVHVLERFFQKDRDQATRIMLHVHNHGVGECGVFTYEVAETKVTQVMDFARQNQHPLQCVMEKK